MIHKVYSYLVRKAGSKRGYELLTFTDPEGMLSVPKGTVEPDELPENAVLRELYEESGILAARLLTCIGERSVRVRGGFDMAGPWEDQLHTAFLLECVEDLPDIWDHIVRSDGIDNGMKFRFGWLPLESALSGKLGYGAEGFVPGLLLSLAGLPSDGLRDPL